MHGYKDSELKNGLINGWMMATHMRVHIDGRLDSFMEGWMNGSSFKQLHSGTQNNVSILNLHHQAF